jgi:hypothetical protein
MTWRATCAKPSLLLATSSTRSLCPHFLSYVASYDVASNICQALRSGRGSLMLRSASPKTRQGLPDIARHVVDTNLNPRCSSWTFRPCRNGFRIRTDLAEQRVGFGRIRTDSWTPNMEVTNPVFLSNGML